jgi:hypothetical protein
MSTGLGSFGLYLPAAAVGYFAARAALALVLGACIGAERQWRQRGAGLRTNALVALGAALFEGLAVVIEGEHGADPTRIAAYIVSGVGFLGGGVILRHGMTVTGINTAATIWCSAAPQPAPRCWPPGQSGPSREPGADRGCLPASTLSIA